MIQDYCWSVGGLSPSAKVPELDLEKITDSDDEYDALYTPVSKDYPRFGPPDSTSTVSWGSPLQAPLVPHYKTHQPHCLREEKIIPENLPSPSDQYMLKYKQYEMEVKENYKQYSQRIADKNCVVSEPQKFERGIHAKQPVVKHEEENSNELTALDEKVQIQQCYTSKPYTVQHTARKSDAEDEAAEKRKQAVVEQVMVDQLSRAVISDPEQNYIADNHSGMQSSFAEFGAVPHRFRNRALHHTKVKTSMALTENLLSNKFRFDARILTRNGHDACRELIGFHFGCDSSLTIYEYRQFGQNRSNALPFIQKGVYCHQFGRKKGRSIGIEDFYVGANLTFLTSEHVGLPDSIKQQKLLTVRITDVDEAGISMLLNNCKEKQLGPIKQEVDDWNTFKAVQGMLKETLQNRGVRTLVGLVKHLQSLDRNGDGVLQKAELKRALGDFHLNVSDKDFESVWLILDQNSDGEIDYAEFIRFVIGEMNEYRKRFVRKAYMKLDPNKTGSVSMANIKKFYCACNHPKVLSGETSEEQLKVTFVESLQETCNNPNEVLYCEFETYYEGLSIGIVNDEDFTNVLKNSWRI
ncbi:calcyphosin-2 [Protopterus annectens]|uniref:calcyphosin-2 n=1 Tax=Protopterus annectens TaxID=7888 RepID=UPI001CFB2DB3|nr:calcyphosin-2 [Protopterus annectens]